MRRGFTLIELLVVIAIIAILAAILFPVFARAKTSARQTTSVSNVRQISMALHMYMTDYNDRYPPGVARTGDNPDEYRWFWPWDFRIRDYMGNDEIKVAPGYPFKLIHRRGRVWGTNYGINWSFAWTNNSISYMELESPAGIVALSLKVLYDLEMDGTADNLDPNLWKEHVLRTGSYPVIGPQAFRRGRVWHMYDDPWGNGFNTMLRPYAGYHQNVTVAFADGHVKSMPISALIGPMPRGFEVGDPANVWDNQ